MPPDLQMLDRDPRNSSWKRAKGRLSLAVDLSTIQVTVLFGLVSLRFGGSILWGWSEAFHQPHEMTCGSTAI
ncbi:hypothetical protein TNCV_48821 [Trichonephila clavipes]|nr:hypothetical protein TNCV_48821 [Trichonephila clavipes]